MEIRTLEAPSLAQYYQMVEGLPGSTNGLFRGQGNSEWELVPSLYRIDNINISGGTVKRNYDIFEMRYLDGFFREGLPYLPPLPRNYFNDRALAQHFGVPTKLLDWTRDPLVALYFAVEKYEEQVDAAVFLLLPDSEALPEQIVDFDHFDVYSAISVTPPAIDRRIPAQKSVFTFHPYGEEKTKFVPLDQRPNTGNLISDHSNTMRRGFAKITIPARHKLPLLQRLLQRGVDRRNLFPGLDGVGANAAIRARTRFWS